MLCEKALTAEKSGRYALAAALYGRAVEEARRLHGVTFVCTYLTLHRSDSLLRQAHLEGVTSDERTALLAESWALVSSSLPLIVRRMDDNAMLPGRGTAVELAFCKRFRQLTRVVFGWPPHTARELQLEGLTLGYSTAARAARRVLSCIAQTHGLNAVEVLEAQAFLLRVVDSMQSAALSLADSRLQEEAALSFTLQQAVTLKNAGLDPAFITSLRAKWSSAAMVQMRRARGLLDTTQESKEVIKASASKLLADVAKHGLMECALPSCGKREASVGQHKRCSACRCAWYCSAEHGALHWREHKPICRATTASQPAAAGEGAARK